PAPQRVRHHAARTRVGDPLLRLAPPRRRLSIDGQQTSPLHALALERIPRRAPHRDDDAVLEKEEAGERPTHPARGIDRRRHGHEDGRDEHAGERQPPAPAHARLPVSAPARSVLAVAAGASGAIAAPPGDVRWLAWLAPALLVLALPEASSRLRIALGVAYAVTLGVGNVGPWMAPAVAKYFGL